ncbi:serine/threonine-protein kinase Pink1, mitochondrial isoform X2 [Diprion similis]|uniref:serine/threonine-protein kinase Pink1, mitochondrial isoform X2 n=1 Tax=Diprion similis TaxID=362088 RepID=UPI001EF7AAD4|nr:serine/threonine-protein kinase Pink1, mitochondrial isoform X2 [Diprion similis]
MSLRTAAQRLLQNGRVLLRSVRNPQYYTQGNKIHVVVVGKTQGQLPTGGNVSAAGRHLGFLGLQARRIFVDNVLKRVTNSLAGDLRRRAAKRLLFGDSRPFFALVGVSLASGTGILTKDDELEGVCWEIREAVSKVQWNTPKNDQNYEATTIEDKPVDLKDFVIGPAIAKGCSAVVYATRPIDPEEKQDSQITVDTINKDLSSFPLAIKMMFNYDAESNATAILRAMYRETVPARKHCQNEELALWEQKMADNKRVLPPHPNIVAMYCVFADRVPDLPGSSKMYPDALPARINPNGSGRNMSLFLLMKRDLKSDNILLDLSEERDNCPSLVITDFGCCLADKTHGLYLPYSSHDIDKGGNSALMAPEIVNAEPGPFTSLNYTKADLWAAGAIAYEIFGQKNPFYGEKGQKPLLMNHSYVESELPPLPEVIPPVIVALIKNMLNTSMYKRNSPDTAATIIELFLWAPSSWLRSDSKLPSSNEILQWLLCLTTKVLCEGRKVTDSTSNQFSQKINEDLVSNREYTRQMSTRSCGRRTMPEYQLIASFLSRVSLINVRDALKWIHNHT